MNVKVKKELGQNTIISDILRLTLLVTSLIALYFLNARSKSYTLSKTEIKEFNSSRYLILSSVFKV